MRMVADAEGEGLNTHQGKDALTCPPRTQATYVQPTFPGREWAGARVGLSVVDLDSFNYKFISNSPPHRFEVDRRG